MEELETEATARTECGIDRYKQQDVLREIKQINTTGACIFWHGVVVTCVLESVVVKRVGKVSKMKSKRERDEQI